MADGTQSISRAIQILKAFDDDNPSRDLGELVDVTGLNKTTVHRILNALEGEGLIERTDGNGYRLGSELIAMGGRAARANNLRDIAHSHIWVLSKDTGETVTLEILRKDSDIAYTLVIDEVLGKHLVGINQYIGTRLPVHATSTGKSILAFLTEDEVSNLLTDNLQRYTDRTQHTSDDLMQELTYIRQQRSSLVSGELEEGLIAIGAPIFDQNSRPIAAISLVGPSVRLNREKVNELTARVRDTANAISHAMGYRNPEPVNEL
ncbi:MAG: IclR family transcriptional regulator [Chloroflexota bacterium]